MRLNLTSIFFKGTVLHEMLHAMGFYHEQSRTDRDQYVKIHLENVQSGEYELAISYL